MSPAFSSTRQMVAFALLLVVLIGLPAFMGQSGLLDRRDVYPTIPWKFGFFPWIQQQIFSETKDIDIAFVGTSHMWWSIDTPLVKKELSKQLGRDAEVITLGWAWQGFDAVNTIAKDLLDRRRVKMLVITDECIQNVPHNISCRWFRIGENSESMQGLSWVGQAQLYGGSILGMPRHLLSLVRPNITEFGDGAPRNWWNDRSRQEDLKIAENLGCMKMRRSIRDLLHYREFHPVSLATSDDVVTYSPETASQFSFTGEVPDYQRHFAVKLAETCRERGIHVVVLNIPMLTDREKTVIPERCNWSEVLGMPVDMVGIPPARLFSGIDPKEVSDLYYDNDHLNQNGQEFYTALITPLIGKLYADRTNRD